MARPRFTGQGFTNPIDSLGLNAESRHRAMPPISNAFMSNEAFHAENVREFHSQPHIQTDLVAHRLGADLVQHQHSLASKIRTCHLVSRTVH